MTDSIILAELTGFCPQLYDSLIACVHAYVDRDVSLAGLNLSNEAHALIGADFSRTDLTRTNFTGSDLTGVNFTGAVLYETQLSYTILNNARFAHSGNGGLYSIALGTQFYGAKMVGVKISGMHFHKADFGHADLADAQFTDSRLTRGEMHNTCLLDAAFRKCELSNVNMCGAVTENTVFADTRLNQVNLMNIDVRSTNSWIKNDQWVEWTDLREINCQ